MAAKSLILFGVLLASLLLVSQDVVAARELTEAHGNNPTRSVFPFDHIFTNGLVLLPH
jgi:predicted nucleic acid-binding protein